MKSIKKITLLLFTALFFVFTSCNKKQNADKPKSEISDEESKLRKPKDGISYDEAVKLQQEYIKTRANFLNEYLNRINHFKKENKAVLIENEMKKRIEDVRDVTFDLETLKQYIAYVEKEVKGKNLKGLGLRVYLGAYPKNDGKAKDPGFATVFFMPTHQPKSKSSDANKFFYWNKDQIIEGVDGLNYGSGGTPPNDLK